MDEGTEELANAAMHRIVARALLHRQTLIRRTTTPAPRFDDDRTFNDFPYDTYYDHVPPAGFGGILPFLGFLIRSAVLWTLLMAAALVTYLMFYLWVMPTTVASQRLHFDYSAAVTAKVASSSSQPSQQSCSQEQVHRFLPHATIDLFAQHSAWEAFDDNVLPRPKVHRHLLHPHQTYFIETSVLMPDSNVNQQVGMFTVVTDLLSSNGTMLASSKRSGRYPHRTPWIAHVRRGVWLLPILVGAAEEATLVTLPSFRHYVESADSPLQHVHVKVLQGDRQPPIEVISGHVRIGEELGWFQELLKEWFFTCLIVGTNTFAAIHYLNWQLLRALGSYVRYRLASQEGADDDEPPCDLDLDDVSFPGGSHDDGDPRGNEGAGSSDGASTSQQAPERRRQRQNQTVVVEDDDDEWEPLQRRFGSRRCQSLDDDSFSTPPQGQVS